MSSSQLERLLQGPIIRKAECGFCDFGQKNIGDEDARGAIIIHQTGKNPEVDWYATLQDTVTSDPETGFRILLLPTGHVRTFAQIGMSNKMVAKYGASMATLSIAIQKVRAAEAEKHEMKYVPMERIDGKCYANGNSQAHVHIKFDEPSKGLAQPFPADTGPWTNKDMFYLRKNGSTELTPYVVAEPIEKQRHSPERMQFLAEQLIEQCARTYIFLERL
ncbi:hypothetical protein HOL21_03350 [Candidatus Woesearchaeota archaeon]|jgi:hypothetical protein|nr:hypothetical protein [Candidatus Woesearchaeota archaeon]MBT5397222.1 hypothetical protein [Candidatus Woesearchaeota archaeon]MBT5924421.1 hypothetical protein [Candidatus Woesearchaeota archaeon]MBT6367232.1 hypothetical protein [Candidatus Woesearchaeota archaeon]MBT7762622.1 hypothetical protein [Candidatus Woesearchaeota archaeon]